MNPIPTISAAPAAAGAAQRDPELYRRCQEFEQVLTSQLLKQGLSQASQGWGSEETSGASNSYREMAFGELANQMGRMGMLGLADTLYQQLAPLAGHGGGS